MKRETEDGCFLFPNCPDNAACCKFIDNPDPDLLESNSTTTTTITTATTTTTTTTTTKQ